MDDVNVPILNRCGIREHVCDILEGGENAFRDRENKYGFSKFKGFDVSGNVSIR